MLGRCLLQYCNVRTSDGTENARTGVYRWDAEVRDQIAPRNAEWALQNLYSTK